MRGIPIARVLGFEIRVHLSWAIILAVIVVSVASQVEQISPGVDAPVRWLLGAIVGGGFLASAVAHELGHAVAARRAGLAGGVIVVYFFGGTTNAAIEATRPRDEVTVGLAGPAVSIAIGVVLVVAGVLGVGVAGPVGVAAQIAAVLGVLNLVLGVVNLVPAFPLDGGRVVQGLAWARTGDPRRAMRVAARSGRLVGYGLAVLGIAIVLTIDQLDGLMLALIGWFLTSAAKQVEQRAQIDELLDEVRVGDVMDAEVASVAPGLTLDTFAGQMLDGTVGPALPVLRDQEVVGVVGASQLRRVSSKRWTELRAEDLMTGSAELPRVEPDTPLRAAFDDLRRTGLDGLPVIGAGGLAGVVTRRGVVDALRERARLRGTTLT